MVCAVGAPDATAAGLACTSTGRRACPLVCYWHADTALFWGRATTVGACQRATKLLPAPASAASQLFELGWGANARLEARHR